MKKVLVACILGIFLLSWAAAQADFETNSLLIKSNVKQGDLETKSITISSKTGGDFSLSIGSLEGVQLKESSFTISAGGEKTAEIKFDSTDIKPGIYIGGLEIKGPVDSATIPIVFEVESQDVFFDANIDIPPAYKEIEQGGKLTYQAKIFDLAASGGLQDGMKAAKVDVSYVVYGLDGKILMTRDDQIVVDEQSQLTNTIGFPANVATGTYILGAIVKYKESVGISTQTFDIKNATTKTAAEAIPNYALIGAIIFAVVIFFGTVSFLVYLLKERDKVLGEIRKFNERETKMVSQLMREQKELAKNKKHYGKRNLQDEIDKKLKELKNKQQERVNEIQKLKKAGNKKEMEKRLEEWRHKGYNTSMMDYKIAGLTTNEMKQLLDKWKRKYGGKVKPKG
jgi:hypothetical protein